MEGDNQAPETLYRPGEQVQPGTSAPTPPPPPPQPSAPQAPQPQPPVPQAPAPQPTLPSQLSTQTAQVDDYSITWSASEYLHHQKQPGWYLMLLVSAVVLAAVLFITQHDYTAPIVILMGAAALWVFGARKPRALTYRIDSSGLTIEQKRYPFEKFRSFSVVDDGEVPSLLLTPLQRFIPPISIYYDPTDEGNIVNAISQFLPHEDKELNAVDRLSKRLKF